MLGVFDKFSSVRLILEDKPDIKIAESHGQVDSPESPETPEITEMTENFTKVTKYLTKPIQKKH